MEKQLNPVNPKKSFHPVKMKYLVIYIVLFIYPTFVLSQNDKDIYETKTEQINPQKIDSLCELFRNLNWSLFINAFNQSNIFFQ